MLLIRQLILTLIIGSSFAITAELATTPAKQISVDHHLRFTGTVEAVNQGTASSETSGRVEATLVDVGDLVQKNDIILQLRDTQQRANFKTAEAGVAAAQAQFDSAEKEFQRIRDIRARELVSQSQLDNALASRDAARASLDAALARLTNAEEQLEFTRVRAPYSGIVLERHIEVGELVNPGTPLYTGMSLERLRVTADVPQKDIDAIRTYKKASINTPAGEQLVVTDNDLTFFGYADPVTSTFKIRVNLPAGTEGLYPGMYLPTSFKIGIRNVLVVPAPALVNRGEVTAVYIQQGSGINFRQVKTGLEQTNAEGENVVEILSGVREGEAIILNPASAIAQIKSQSE